MRTPWWFWAWMAFCLVFWVTAGVVAWHFIAKWW